MLPSLTVGLLTLTKAMSDQANPRNPRAGRPCHMKLKSSSKASVAIMILLSLLVAAATALACSWPGTSHSVRFNDYQTERQMGRLPPLPTMADGLNDARAYWEAENEDYYETSEKNAKQIDSLWAQAETAEKDGNLGLVETNLQHYLKATSGSRSLGF